MRLSGVPVRPVLLAFGLVAAGALGGCGVKGALEPPPGVTVEPLAASPATVPPGTASAPPPVVTATPQPPLVNAPPPLTTGASSRAVLEAPAAKRSSPLDWLIN